ncbi:hypothetical protein PHMEG_00011598 [Phytophthora megakarya]|uniref:START domain-containing protein n=1 Tax=Phytophthora megakarya TaxID=4795 RepID=A0A225WAU8_9STRA|nr:hypothetical protein PHMEG_00011598 [Phytophthora megakarya]
MKGRFIVNPFPTVPLLPSDESQLHDLVNSLVKAGLERYTAFLKHDNRHVDQQRWKLVKSRETARVYMEKSVPGNQENQDLPSLLCVGTTTGQLEDLMFGVVNPTLEVMRIKASYVDDLSGAAVLANVEEPTLDEPFKSLVVKWMELDIPLHNTSLVKNRDYIYAEATDIIELPNASSDNLIELPNGDRIGYHLLHSINFPQTHELPNRVRGNLSICSFFRQLDPEMTEIYVTGIMDPAGGLMKKLAWKLEKHYKESRLLGNPNKRAQCVSCQASITGRKLGDFGKTDATCKLCFCYVCHACKIHKKISFVTPDMLLVKRKVTFSGSETVPTPLKLKQRDPSVTSAKDKFDAPHVLSNIVSECFNALSSNATTDTNHLRIGQQHLRMGHKTMRHERFTASPFDKVALTMGDRSQLEALAQTFVSDNLRQYLAHSALGLDKVDECRWKVVKAKEALRVYTERSKRDMARRVRKHSSNLGVSRINTDDEADYMVSELPVMFSAGTLVGALDDVMFGVVNPSLELMRIKSSYVDDVSGAAVLASIVEPTMDDPFCSLVIKWMEIDLPLVKNRDYVYMEATGMVQLGPRGDRIGYHLMHSVHFPQTTDRPHKVRGRLSMCSFFRQTSPDTVEHYSSGTIDPGGVIPRSILVRSTAVHMLAPLRYAYCGQMKKLTWMLQQKREERRLGGSPNVQKPEHVCVTCRSKAGGLFSTKCRICLGDLCMSCSIKKKLSFLSPDRSLVRHKVSVCTSCMLEGLHVSASKAARDQLFGPSTCSAFATCSMSETSSDLSSSPTIRSRCPQATV